MAFKMPQKVLFRHCDPAGIVFFPRYFEMVNDCVEAFFAGIGHSFEAMHPEAGVPTAAIEAEFVAPSRHGDLLELSLACRRLGRTSLSYGLTAVCGGALRLRVAATLVHIDAAGRPAPWPEDLRAALETELEGAD